MLGPVLSEIQAKNPILGGGAKIHPGEERKRGKLCIFTKGGRISVFQKKTSMAILF